MPEREIFYSNPGEQFKTTYTPKLRDDGSFDLIPTGKQDIQEYIDSFAEETCMALLIKRCEVGDLSVLSKVQGNYGDFTEFPKTYRDLLQIVIDGRSYFDSLPVDVRGQFGNSFEQWFAQIGEDNWLKIMSNGENTVEEEVIKDAE